MHRFRDLATFTLAPTLTDVGLLLVGVLVLDLAAPVADLASLLIASTVSYLGHRIATYRSNPFRRWVRHPGAFVVVAALAALVDVVVVAAAWSVTDLDTVGAVVAAKAVAMVPAVAVRAVGYRFVLAEDIAVAQGRHTEAPSDGVVRLSVVVPAYREVDRIGATVRAVRAELADVAADGGVEIIVVDDGSGDGTADAARLAGADQVVVLPTNRGKGAAVRAGMIASRGRTAAFIDADLAYDPGHLRTLLVAVEDGRHAVIGNRRHPESETATASGLRAVGSRLVNTLASVVLLAAPHDTQCGLKAFRGDVARALFARTRIDGFAFDIEVLHLVEEAEWSLDDIPVVLRDTGGGSTVRIVADVVTLAVDLARVRYWSSTGRYEPSSTWPGSGRSAPERSPSERSSPTA